MNRNLTKYLLIERGKTNEIVEERYSKIKSEEELQDIRNDIWRDTVCYRSLSNKFPFKRVVLILDSETGEVLSGCECYASTSRINEDLRIKQEYSKTDLDFKLHHKEE